MTRQPQLSSIDLWNDHEQLFLELLLEAVAELVGQSTEANENDLNRRLFRAIIRVSYNAARSGIDVPTVVPEGRNPPAASDKERAKREFKIPDFYWAYVDPLVDDPNQAYKQFVVECKRLTSPESTYFPAYVRSGIARFINQGHGYGQEMKSGAMVGYLQKVFVDDALTGVNGVAINDHIPPLTTKHRAGETGGEFDHDIYRSFPVSPFHLYHIWARIGPEPVI